MQSGRGRPPAGRSHNADRNDFRAGRTVSKTAFHLSWAIVIFGRTNTGARYFDLESAAGNGLQNLSGYAAGGIGEGLSRFPHGTFIAITARWWIGFIIYPHRLAAAGFQFRYQHCRIGYSFFVISRLFSRLHRNIVAPIIRQCQPVLRLTPVDIDYVIGLRFPVVIEFPRVVSIQVIEVILVPRCRRIISKSTGQRDERFAPRYGIFPGHALTRLKHSVRLRYPDDLPALGFGVQSRRSQLDGCPFPVASISPQWQRF